MWSNANLRDTGPFHSKVGASLDIPAWVRGAWGTKGAVEIPLEVAVEVATEVAAKVAVEVAAEAVVEDVAGGAISAAVETVPTLRAEVLFGTVEVLVIGITGAGIGTGTLECIDAVTACLATGAIIDEEDKVATCGCLAIVPDNSAAAWGGTIVVALEQPATATGASAFERSAIMAGAAPRE
jgi:hypothetical protein